MRSNFAVAFAVGIACIAIAVAGIFYMQRGDRIDLPGKILKVRTAALDDESSIAVIDFRIANPSDILFEVRTVTAQLEGSDGKISEGQISSDSDAARVMQALPVLGEKYNKTLMVKERIGAHGSADRMVAVRYPVPLEKLDGRKRLTVRIEEVDGKVFEYSDK
ncbi:MAG TPA: hypothetical protein VMH28_10655 [Candidatus Acidoferrales bacterium]|nr:hypothetical protein [Bryobacteraceae bacterium]HTS62479.1 hypothetical protein [Candidatus Acidoferrales bacterium]